MTFYQHSLYDIFQYLGGGGSGTGFDGEVATYDLLPLASEHIDETYIVLNSSGFLWNRRKGFYRSTGSEWFRLSNVEFNVLDTEATFIDDADDTKRMHFELSGLTSGINLKLAIPDITASPAWLMASDGSIPHVDDTPYENPIKPLVYKTENETYSYSGAFFNEHGQYGGLVLPDWLHVDGRVIHFGDSMYLGDMTGQLFGHNQVSGISNTLIGTPITEDGSEIPTDFWLDAINYNFELQGDDDGTPTEVEEISYTFIADVPDIDVPVSITKAMLVKKILIFPTQYFDNLRITITHIASGQRILEMPDHAAVASGLEGMDYVGYGAPEAVELRLFEESTYPLDDNVFDHSHRPIRLNHGDAYEILFEASNMTLNQNTLGEPKILFDCHQGYERKIGYKEHTDRAQLTGLLSGGIISYIDELDITAVRDSGGFLSFQTETISSEIFVSLEVGHQLYLAGFETETSYNSSYGSLATITALDGDWFDTDITFTAIDTTGMVEYTDRIGWTSGTGQIVDFSYPHYPTVDDVSWDDEWNFLAGDITTDTSSIIGYNVAGVPSSQNVTTVGSIDRKNYIYIGGFTHIGNVVNRVITAPIDVAYGAGVSFSDFLSEVIGPANVNGNIYSGVAGTLQLQVSSGSAFIEAGNFRINTKDPDIIGPEILTAIDPIPQFYLSYNGTGDAVIMGKASEIDPTQWYNPATESLEPVGNNEWTIQRIFRSRQGATYVAYGQELFSKYDDAEAIRGSEEFTEKQPLPLTLYRSSLIVKGNASDLTDESDAKFFAQPSFRVSGVGSATGVIPGVTSPGGSVRSIQFNDTSFGGDDDFIFDQTTNSMSIGDTDNSFLTRITIGQEIDNTLNGLTFTGESTTGNDRDNGATIQLLKNTPDEMGLFFVQHSDINDIDKAGVYFTLGDSLTSIAAHTGSGELHRNLNLGHGDCNIGIGFESSDSPDLITHKLTVNGDIKYIGDVFHEGTYIVDELSVEPFGGIGPYENIVDYSEDFTQWIQESSVTIDSITELAPDGTYTATQLTRSGSPSGVLDSSILDVLDGESLNISCWVKHVSSSSGNNRMGFYIGSGGGGVGTGAFQMSGFSEWTRVEFDIEAHTGEKRIYVNKQDDNCSWLMWGMQVTRLSGVKPYVSTTGIPIEDSIGGWINGDFYVSDKIRTPHVHFEFGAQDYGMGIRDSDNYFVISTDDSLATEAISVSPAGDVYLANELFHTGSVYLDDTVRFTAIDALENVMGTRIPRAEYYNTDVEHWIKTGIETGYEGVRMGEVKIRPFMNTLVTENWSGMKAIPATIDVDSNYLGTGRGISAPEGYEHNSTYIIQSDPSTETSGNIMVYYGTAERNMIISSLLLAAGDEDPGDHVHFFIYLGHKEVTEMGFDFEEDKIFFTRIPRDPFQTTGIDFFRVDFEGVLGLNKDDNYTFYMSSDGGDFSFFGAAATEEDPFGILRYYPFIQADVTYFDRQHVPYSQYENWLDASFGGIGSYSNYFNKSNNAMQDWTINSPGNCTITSTTEEAVDGRNNAAQVTWTGISSLTLDSEFFTDNFSTSTLYMLSFDAKYESGESQLQFALGGGDSVTVDLLEDGLWHRYDVEITSGPSNADLIIVQLNASVVQFARWNASLGDSIYPYQETTRSNTYWGSHDHLWGAWVNGILWVSSHAVVEGDLDVGSMLTVTADDSGGMRLKSFDDSDGSYMQIYNSAYDGVTSRIKFINDDYSEDYGSIHFGVRGADGWIEAMSIDNTGHMNIHESNIHVHDGDIIAYEGNILAYGSGGNASNFVAGLGAGSNLTTAMTMVLIGVDAGAYIEDGISDVYVGSLAGNSINLTSGGYNVGVGHQSLYDGSDLFSNVTAVGAFAGEITTGDISNSSMFGYYAGSDSSGQYGLYLGDHAGAGEDDDYKLWISSNGNDLIEGDFTNNWLKIHGDLEYGYSQNFNFLRDLPIVVDDIVYLGSFDTASGGSSIKLTAIVSTGGFSVTKEYIIPLQYNGTSGNWVLVNPISNTGDYGVNDFDIDIHTNTSISTLRARRTGGTTAATAYFSLEYISNNGIFTPSTLTESATAPTEFYDATVLTQVGGNVGIGIDDPEAMFHIYDGSGIPSEGLIKIVRDNNLTTPTVNNAALFISDHSGNYPLQIEDHTGNSIFTIKGDGVAIFGDIPASDEEISMFTFHEDSIDTGQSGLAGITINQIDDTGDAALHLVVDSETRWSLYVDNIDEDEFKIYSSTLGDTAFHIDNDGNVRVHNGFISAYGAGNVVTNFVGGDHAGGSLTSGFQNVFIGYQAGDDLQDKHWLTAVGYQALGNTNSNVYGTTALGHQAGYDSTAAFGVYLGHGAGVEETTDNKLHIASGSYGDLIEGSFSDNWLELYGDVSTEGFINTQFFGGFGEYQNGLVNGWDDYTFNEYENTSITSYTASAPDGTNTAMRVYFSPDSTQDLQLRMNFNDVFNVSASTSYKFSFYYRLEIIYSGSSSRTVNLDLSDGGYLTAYATNDGTWERVTGTVTTSGSGSDWIDFNFIGGSYGDDHVFDFWGFQISEVESTFVDVQNSMAEPRAGLWVNGDLTAHAIHVEEFNIYGMFEANSQVICSSVADLPGYGTGTITLESGKHYIGPGRSAAHLENCTDQIVFQDNAFLHNFAIIILNDTFITADTGAGIQITDCFLYHAWPGGDKTIFYSEDAGAITRLLRTTVYLTANGTVNVFDWTHTDPNSIFIMDNFAVVTANSSCWSTLGKIKGSQQFVTQLCKFVNNSYGFIIEDCEEVVIDKITMSNDRTSFGTNFFHFTGNEIKTMQIGRYMPTLKADQYGIKLDAGVNYDSISISGCVPSGVTDNFFEDLSIQTGDILSFSQVSISNEPVTGIYNSVFNPGYALIKSPSINTGGYGLSYGLRFTLSGFTTYPEYNGDYMSVGYYYNPGIYGGITLETEIPYLGWDTTGTVSYELIVVDTAIAGHSYPYVDMTTSLYEKHECVVSTDNSTAFDGTYYANYNFSDQFYIMGPYPAAAVGGETGTFEERGLNQTDPIIKTSGNTHVPDSLYRAFGNLDSGTLQTPITILTYTPIVFHNGLTEHDSSQRWKLIDAVNGIWEYTGIEAFSGDIELSVVIEEPGTDYDTYRFKESINGVLPAYNSTDAGYFKLELRNLEIGAMMMFPLEGIVTGDQVQVMVAGEGTTDDIYVYNAHFRIK